MASYGTSRCPTFRRWTGTRVWLKAFYAKIAQPVLTESGAKRALVYVGANAGPGTLRPDYLAEVLAAARAWPLTGEAIGTLEQKLGVGRSGVRR